MPTVSPPREFSELMLLNGLVLLFGPDYLKNSLSLRAQVTGSGSAVLCCEKIDDVSIPSGPALTCLMVFFHRVPAGSLAMDWPTKLLDGIVLKSHPPRNLGVADKSPEDPSAAFTGADGDREMHLMVTWRRPLESSHVVDVGRKLERSYLANGGQYGKPSLLARLRKLLS